MKKSLCLLASLLALNLTPVFGQQFPHPGEVRSSEIDTKTGQAIVPGKPELTKFNLDFPGGTPEQLVKAIEKAMGKPLNAIIPTEDADIQLPPLKMNDVVTPQLFAALEVASRKTVAVSTGQFGNSYSVQNSSYGFNTADSPVTDTSIWYFHAEKPILPPMVSTEKICRFYSLSPYLDHGFTVDDITTAIQTGWKMAGVTPTPELSYHKETKLLIAFGEPDELRTIDNVLQTLPSSNATRSEIDQLKSDMKNLQDVSSEVFVMGNENHRLAIQIGELSRKVSALTQKPASAPEEKSGK